MNNTEQMDGSACRELYRQQGYFVVRNLFDGMSLRPIRRVVDRFFETWKQQNEDFYASQAVNAAYLTSSTYLNAAERLVLFRLIGSQRLMPLVHAAMAQPPCFMNTQLFFDPVNGEQNNYWHRDPQYHLSLEEQQQALHTAEVIHVRIPLKAERGLELIPGTHRRWDTPEELAVRLEQDGRCKHDDLAQGAPVALAAGDALVFSANMIHRGLYGGDRLALDILYCAPQQELLAFVDRACLPDDEAMTHIDEPAVFARTLALLG